LPSFQCSSASRKFLNYTGRAGEEVTHKFQCSSASRKFLNDDPTAGAGEYYFRFSALQRAENSSIDEALAIVPASLRFSALQRAENSSIVYTVGLRAARISFQCSSASRKFLNLYAV